MSLTAEERAAIVDKLNGNILALEEALNLWEQAGIPRKTIVILLSHYTKISQRTINVVLEGIDALFETYFEDEEE